MARDYRSQIDRICDEARDAMAERLSMTMLLARMNVTAATPVDTNHAASNWVLSVGAPYTGVDGSREQVSTAAQDAGDARVRRYSGKDLKAGRRIYLRDNVFYMRFLNRGSSPQAPAGFIVKAILSKNATRHMPRGTKRQARAALRSMALRSIKNGSRRR